MATTITLDSLNKDTELKTAPKYEDSILANGNSIINNSLNSILSDQKTVNDSLAGTKTALETIAKNNEALKDKASFKSSQYDIMGVNKEKENLDKYSQELNNISANVTALSRESQAIPLQIQEQFKNTGATDAGVAPIQTGKLRENAIKALTQASLADIAIANIKNTQIRYQTAKEKADQAVDLKFEPIEQEIKSLKEQLELNKAYITDPAEKRLLASQERVLNERARLLENKKQEEKDKNDLKIEIAKNGGNPSVIDKAKTFSDAINLAKNQLVKKDNQIVQLDNGETILIDKLSGKILKSYGGAKTSSVGGFNITKDMVNSTYGGDLVSVISNVIKQSGAKKDDKLDSAVSVISGINKIAKANKEGVFEGIGILRLPNKFTNKEGRTTRADLSALDLRVQQWASGAQLSKDQTDLVRKMVPESNDTDSQVRDKLNSLTNYMLSQVRGNLATQGVDFIPPTTFDYWEQTEVDSDPLGILGADRLNLNTKSGFRFGGY